VPTLRWSRASKKTQGCVGKHYGSAGSPETFQSILLLSSRNFLRRARLEIAGILVIVHERVTRLYSRG
jgi:hypothetical protein